MGTWRVELAESLRALAEMNMNLIPLFDCGCKPCLERAAKSAAQLWDEFADLVAAAPEEAFPTRSRPGHGSPLDLDATRFHFSDQGFRELARILDHLADEFFAA